MVIIVGLLPDIDAIVPCTGVTKPLCGVAGGVTGGTGVGIMATFWPTVKVPAPVGALIVKDGVSVPTVPCTLAKVLLGAPGTTAPGVRAPGTGLGGIFIMI